MEQSSNPPAIPAEEPATDFSEPMQIHSSWLPGYVERITRAKDIEIADLRAALAAPASEPVAYWDKAVGGFYIAGAVIPEKVKDRVTPLYAAAPAPMVHSLMRAPDAQPTPVSGEVVVRPDENA